MSRWRFYRERYDAAGSYLECRLCGLRLRYRGRASHDRSRAHREAVAEVEAGRDPRQLSLWGSG